MDLNKKKPSIESEYLEKLKGLDYGYSCGSICCHTPKCAWMLGMYFCRMNYSEAKPILMYHKLFQVCPSLKNV